MPRTPPRWPNQSVALQATDTRKDDAKPQAGQEKGHNQDWGRHNKHDVPTTCKDWEHGVPSPGLPRLTCGAAESLANKKRTMAEKIQANERKVKKWLRTANPVKLLEAKQNTRRADPNNKWRKTAPKDTNEPSTAPAKMCV